MLTVSGICEGVELIWSWSNDRREPIGRYGLVSGNDCNNRHPSGWTLYGSNDLVSGNDCNNRHPSGWTLYGSNDGENWTILQSKSGQ